MRMRTSILVILSARLRFFAGAETLSVLVKRHQRMLKIAIILGLAAVACFAQTPTRPQISETFSSAGTFEFHDVRGTFFGNFIMDRDQANKMAVENVTYKVQNGTEHYEKLDHFETTPPEEYVVRFIVGTEPHCEHLPLNGTLPTFWGWVPYSTYAGKNTYHERVFDRWTLDTGGVRFDLFVEQTDPNIPRFYGRRMGPITQNFDFMSFAPGTPPTKDFAIPRECV